MRYGYKKAAVLAAMLLIAAMLIVPVRGIADAGDFSGSSDYGGSSDWGDSDWGSSDWGGSDWGGSSSFGGDFDWITGLIVLAVILWMVFSKSSGKKQAVKNAGAKPTEQSLLQPISLLRESDPNFSEAIFAENAGKLYVDLQAAWQAKNFEPMRPHMTEGLYRQFERQLKAGYIDRSQTNIIERIAVLDVSLMGFMQDERNDILVARLKTRITDYVIDDSTGKIVRGSNTAELFMEYEWTFIRPKGQLTPSDAELDSMHCPSCGAPVDINRSAICEYCGTALINEQHDWVISQIKGISQRTGN